MKKEFKHVYLTKEQYIEYCCTRYNRKRESIEREWTNKIKFNQHHKGEELIEIDGLGYRNAIEGIIKMFPDALVEMHEIDYIGL